MLQVKTPEEVLALIQKEFVPLTGRTEHVPLVSAAGRVLAEEIVSAEYVPDFDRSTVDGYACRAADTFGCSVSIPAVLTVAGEVLMGRESGLELEPGSCACVPTGGAIPKGADCAVMLEYTEDFGDGTAGILKAGAPGMNIIFRGDDLIPGKTVLKAGRILRAQDIGALAAIGRSSVPVVRKLKVGVLSTGDELVPPESVPAPGQMRDVNSTMLAALLSRSGADPVPYGIVKDDEQALRETFRDALYECDAVILSGGSSVGAKDAACRVIADAGELLLHGIAVKPGKPTILGKAGNKPLIGLPGHPVAALFAARLFVLPLLDRLSGCEQQRLPVPAKLSESVSANHGRAQVVACRLERRDGILTAVPVRSKSGLITLLAGSDGYFIIDRDCEGLPKGADVQVYPDRE
ncbi:MAG: molybdopterin molybdotransferase MoeA [Oscillospiraceae bacterium]|nr:molybdopterin molybdotransferase MoeA [Oscillospiraceae bacterium]